MGPFHRPFRRRWPSGGARPSHARAAWSSTRTSPLLGPDALGVSAAELRRALEHSAVAVKARLMDQHRLAGVGNLMADELLWRASLAPHRRSSSLTPAEHRRLHRHLTATVDELIRRGGSHLGDLMPERATGGRCPRDGTELVRSTVGGRTSWWCPHHQH